MNDTLRQCAVERCLFLPGQYSSSKDHECFLFSDNRALLVSNREVIVIKGLKVAKKLTYDLDVLLATYTTFQTQKDKQECLVICMHKCAHIYYEDGKYYNLSFPFKINSAFKFESGIVLEKQSLDEFAVDMLLFSHQLHVARFLTLVSPMGEYRTITSSSTSVVSPHEKLLCFPKEGLQKRPSICATFNSYDSALQLYSVRSSSRPTPSRSGSLLNSRPQKRKHSLIVTPTASRIREDEPLDIPHVHGLMVSHQPSINMEKKRTSTLLLDASSMARMASMTSDGGFGDNKTKLFPLLYNVSSNALQKDMLLTKMEAFGISGSLENIRVYNLHFESQEAAVLVCPNKEVRIIIYDQVVLMLRFQSTYTIKCVDCMPLDGPNQEGLVLVLKDEKTLVLVNPFLDLVSAPMLLNTDNPCSSIGCLYDDHVILRTKLNSLSAYKLILNPNNDLTKKCLFVFKYLSGSKINHTFWMLWRTAISLVDDRDEWQAFNIALLAAIYPFNMVNSGSAKSKNPASVSNQVTDLLPKAERLQQFFALDSTYVELAPYIVLSLHLIREEQRLNVLWSENLNALGILLVQLVTWMGWPEDWRRYYDVDKHIKLETSTKFLLACLIETPPNLFQSLASLFTDHITRYLTFSQLVEESGNVDVYIMPRTNLILKVFELIVSPHYGPSDIIDLLCDEGMTIYDLKTLPAGIMLPIIETIIVCQENPVFEWTKKTLELVGRRDLSLFLEDNLSWYSSSHSSSIANSQHFVKDMNHLLFNILDKNDTVSAWDGQSEADRINVTKLVFDHDRRYYEITTILHQTKTQSATLRRTEETSEYDYVVQLRQLAAMVALRTLTLPMGRAALFFASRMPLLTERFPIPKFNFNTCIYPTMNNILLSKGTISDEVTDWGYFHNGVSSGLSIHKSSKGITGSWIIYNKPPELNLQHAGFLLGLGLNGHLKRLEEWHIYNYLGPKHPLTSVGLLLGMAASMKGTSDNKLTKVLSIHAVALLPQGANDLNVPVIVQTAGLIGIGLLYMETQHRRMSEILLSQITGYVNQNDSEQISESYRLAAGISLGYVNLGKGDDLKGLNDTHVVDRLLTLAVSMKDYQPVQELDKSCSGAIIGLGLVYLKTENSSVAEKLKLPATEQTLDYVRPILLLLRCFTRSIIMWKSINPSITWVDSQIPKFVSEKLELPNGRLNSDQLGYYNIIAGACMAIAIKYASSQSIEARDTIFFFLSSVTRALESLDRSPSNYDEKLAYRNCHSIESLMALCLSVVMAGSGDLDTLRELRKLQAATDQQMNFGNYMALNMALGFLFLGGGQFAFSLSNFAIANLITSMYPVFPDENSESDAHLQALRHFWALSVEPRCIVIRDVDTREPCKVPVTIKLKSGEIRHLVTPCLLPDLNEVMLVETNSSEHFNIHIDFQLNSEYLEIFKKSLTLYVYRKQDYALLQATIEGFLKSENKTLQIQNGEFEVDKDVKMLLEEMRLGNGVSDFEKQVCLYEASDRPNDIDQANAGLSIFNIIDSKLELDSIASNPQRAEDLWNLKLVFAFTDRRLNDEIHYITTGFIERLKQKIWELVQKK